MKAKFSQAVRVPSLILAAALQIFPMARATLPSSDAATNVLAIIFRWAVGAAAVGAVDAVSGASTTITTPASTNITEGNAFAMRLATAPELAYYWKATNVPAGLSLTGINGGSFWQIAGTPTVVGTFNVTLSASDSGTFPPTHTVTGTMVIHIAPPLGSQPVIASPPASLMVTQNQSATFSVAVNGLAPLTCQWRLNGFGLAGKSGTNLLINSVTTNDAGLYTVVVTNIAGSVTSAPASLTVILPPVITTDPQSQTNLAGTTFNLSVAASSAGPLSYQWFKDGAALANSAHISGAQSNSLRINLAQTNDSGGYTALLANAAGSATSQVATLLVAPLLSRLTVFVNGQGTVSPDYNGQFLQIGTTYTLTASAGSGFHFTNWTGSLKTNSASLTFVMKSNLVLQANFLFPFVPGIYRGLYYDPNGVTVSNSGAFTITTTSGGKYSGSLSLAGKKFGLSGAFNIFGNASNRLSLNAGNTAIVSFSIDSADTDRIAGSVSNASWFTTLSGDRATFNAANPAPQSGNYTLIVPGASGGALAPAGTSFGTLKINASGGVTFAGSLADGTKISQATAVSKDGFWPLYVPLYSGNGLVLGWQNFTNTATNDFSGPVCWIKTAQPKAKYFPAGFALLSSLSGAAYVPPAPGNATINFQSGAVIFSGGGLSQNYTNIITILPNNKATNIAGIKFNLTVTPKTGVLTGSFVNPENAKTIPLNGVILQKQNLGAGFFLGTNLSGRINF